MLLSPSLCVVVCCCRYSMCAEIRVCAVLVAQTVKRWWVSLGTHSGMKVSDETDRDTDDRGAYLCVTQFQ